tara:strand:+ start:5 stop:1189 length:1185 start_codon:yes stop_codon:yes gene_type:complete
MEEKIKEYDKYFKNFYNEYFKYKHQFKENNNQSNKKLKCLECTTNKRFILDEDELIFSCGPKNSEDKKCGKQYTIKLPKYINFRELYELYNEQINGTFNYTQNNLLEYDLQNLSGKLNIGEDLEKQIQLIKNSKISFDKLISDYNEYNNLNEYKEKLMNLSEKRYKNSIDKKKIMKKIMNEELSEEEKIIERKKYAILIQENKEFIELIQELRIPNKNYIMIQQPEILNHTGKELKEEKEKEKKDKLIDIILDHFKSNDGILSRDDYNKIRRINDYKTKWETLLFMSLQKPSVNNPDKRPYKYKLQEEHGSIIKKPKTNDPEFIELTDNWKKLLSIETFENIADEEKLGDALERIQTEQIIEATAGENESYKFKQEQEDGTIKLVYHLSPESPR